MMMKGQMTAMTSATKTRNRGLRKALRAAKGIRPLARTLGLTPGTVFEWQHIPVERVFEIERIFKIAREELRPDIFDVPRPPGVERRPELGGAD
jgi:DNA-binding transcriptional regulator YdaS (Cro superfamily)